MRRLAILVILLALPQPVPAQVARISGLVMDEETGAPLPDSHIFVSGTTAGTVAGPDGRFELLGIPLGANRLVISRVGYLREAHDVMVRRPIGFEMDFRLKPRIIPLGEITVTAPVDPNFENHLEIFRRAFLGTSLGARQTRILNPEVLTFRPGGRKLEAFADAPIEVENRALGYRILYFLRSFQHEKDETRQEGEALFTELSPADEAETAAWARAREAAWRGSSRHFLHELVGLRTREAGFYIYTAEKPDRTGGLAQSGVAPIRRAEFALPPEELVRPGPSAREFVVSFRDHIQVVYTGEREDRAYRAWQGLQEPEQDDFQRSWLGLTLPEVHVDLDGGVLEPYAVRYYGHMAFERLADLIPRDYRPESAGRE